MHTVNHTYFIKSKLNGLVLDILVSNPLPGAFIQTWTQNNGLGQQWTITDDGFIKSKLNGMVLEIRGSNPRPGAFIQIGHKIMVWVNSGQLLVMDL